MFGEEFFWVQVYSFGFFLWGIIFDVQVFNIAPLNLQLEFMIINQKLGAWSSLSSNTSLSFESGIDLKISPINLVNLTLLSSFATLNLLIDKLPYCIHDDQAQIWVFHCVSIVVFLSNVQK